MSHRGCEPAAGGMADHEFDARSNTSASSRREDRASVAAEDEEAVGWQVVDSRSSRARRRPALRVA
jgi:hypothetical protein